MPLYYPSSTTYFTFGSSASGGIDDILYNSPGLTDQTSPGGGNQQWIWIDSSTPSADVGPTSGEGSTGTDGYIYTEASAPSTYGDLFWLELESTSASGVPYSYDAATYAINIDFSSNQRGDNNYAGIQVYTNEASSGWVARGTDFGGGDVGTGGVQIWRQRQVDLTGLVSSTDTRVAIPRVTFPSSGVSWHNDVGIDRVRITLTELVLYEVKGATFFHNSTTALGGASVSLWFDNGDDTITFKNQVTSDSTDGSFVFTGVSSTAASHFITATINSGSSDLMDISERTIAPSSTYGGSVDLYLRSQVDKSETAGDGDLRLRGQSDKLSTSTGVAFFGHGLLLSRDRNRLVV